MSTIVKGLSEIIDRYDAVFCDVWGVVHNGKAAHVDAVEALMQARLKGKHVSLVTNSPKSPIWIEGTMKKMKVPDTAYDQIITAGEATQYSLFGSSYKKVYFIGTEDDRTILRDLPQGVSMNMEETRDYKEADVVLCAGPEYGVRDELEDYALELQQLYSMKLPMYCANPDIVVDHGDKRIICGGAIAQDYEKLGGTVFQFGKPHPPIYQLAREKLQNDTGRDVSPSHILFIGDGVATDLKGAMLEDMDALFVTGGLAADELLDSNAQIEADKLENYLQAHNLDPFWSINHLSW